MTVFKMHVTDLFVIGEKTVFSGEFESTTDVVKPTTAKLLVNGQETQRLEVQGPVHANMEHFDLWTTEEVDLDHDLVTSSEVWLVAE